MCGRSFGESQFKPVQPLNHFPSILREENFSGLAPTQAAEQLGGGLLANLVRQTIAPTYMSSKLHYMFLNDFGNPESLDYEQFQQKVQQLSSLEAQGAAPQERAYLPNFSIETDVQDTLNRNSDLLLPDAERNNLLSAISTKIKKFTKAQRLDSIRRYAEKKNKRKSPTYIRYKIRQDLAGQRKRNKGKFVRNRRVDLAKVAEELMRGGVNRAGVKGSNGSNESALRSINFLRTATFKSGFLNRE